MSKFLSTRKGFSKYYGRVTKTGGVILLLTGVLIATNQPGYKFLYFDNLSFPNYAWLMSDISILGIFVADISFSGSKILLWEKLY